MSRYGIPGIGTPYRYLLYEDPEDDMYYSRLPNNEVLEEKLNAVLSALPCIGVPPEPSPICGCVYLGTTADAENIALIKSFGISFILNCAGGHPLGLKRQRAKYPPESGIQGYEELPIEEWEDSDIRSFFDRAHNLIDYWRGKGGKVLIHCPGVSRSGAIALTYLCRTGVPLLQAAKVLKDRRRCVLNNDGFVKQIVSWCRDRGMVDADVDSVRAPRYGRKLDSYRIKTAHLPTFL